MHAFTPLQQPLTFGACAACWRHEPCNVEDVSQQSACSHHALSATSIAIAGCHCLSLLVTHDLAHP